LSIGVPLRGFLNKKNFFETGHYYEIKKETFIIRKMFFKE